MSPTTNRKLGGTGLPRHRPRGGNLFPVPVDPHYIPGSHALGESHGDRPRPAAAVHNMYTKHQMREKMRREPLSGAKIEKGL